MRPMGRRFVFLLGGLTALGASASCGGKAQKDDARQDTPPPAGSGGETTSPVSPGRSNQQASPGSSDYQICMSPESLTRLQDSSFFTVEPEVQAAICNKCPSDAARCAEEGFCYGGYFMGGGLDDFLCGYATECLDDLFWPTSFFACGETDEAVCRTYLREVNEGTPVANRVLKSELMTDICKSCQDEILDCLDGACPNPTCDAAESCVKGQLEVEIDLPCIDEWWAERPAAFGSGATNMGGASSSGSGGSSSGN
jgi:hypothetical protein